MQEVKYFQVFEAPNPRIAPTQNIKAWPFTGGGPYEALRSFSNSYSTHFDFSLVQISVSYFIPASTSTTHTNKEVSRQ